MLEAGSNTRVKNRARLTAYQLVDPANAALRDLIQKHEYANQNAGDFINVTESAKAPAAKKKQPQQQQQVAAAESSDEDAEFSGSDDEERAEWERRRKEKRKN